MGLRDLLRVPKIKIHRRKRSKARSDTTAQPTQGPSTLVEPPPNASAPNLGIASSPLPTPSALTSRAQESTGVQTAYLR